MPLILTNYGHRLVQHLARSEQDAPERGLLMELWSEVTLPAAEAGRYAALIEAGLVEEAGPEVDDDAALLRYRRNPLEQVQRVIFEYTTACNFSCRHCRNGRVAAETEPAPGRLQEAADLMARVGVARYDFIGGEVTRYGDGWLELVHHIRQHQPEALIGVGTNGWFLGARDFVAAGARYADDGAYLDHLRCSGLTHVILSVDGPEPVHDRWRQAPGLFARIMAGIEAIKGAGLLPRVSVVLGHQAEGDERMAWLEGLVDAIYALPAGVPRPAKVSLLLRDDTNYVSNLIDIGNGARLGRPRYPVDQVPDELLRCKSFFRPHPSLWIRANGQLALCPLIDAGEGFGDVRRRGLLDVLNRVQETFVYRLHAEGRLGRYRRHLERKLFGDAVGHVCTLRAVLTLIARAMHERGVAPDDSAALWQINVEVARSAGFIDQG